MSKNVDLFFIKQGITNSGALYLWFIEFIRFDIRKVGQKVNVRITFTYKTPKGIKTTFYGEDMPAREAFTIAQDIERTGRKQELFFVGENEQRWTMKELSIFLEDIQTEPTNIKIYFDGGFDIKKEQAGLGFVIYYEQNNQTYRIRKNARIDGISSNNEAEYAALHLAIKELEWLGVHHMPVHMVGDSLVVINQMKDEWPVYEDALNDWIDRIEEDIKRLGINPSYSSVSRKNNKEADQLATQALNGVKISSKKEINEI